MRGKIIRMQGPDQFIVRTADNKEVTFFSQPETRYTIRGRAGRYADLRVDTDVNIGYITRDDRYLVNTVTVGEVLADPPTAAGARVEDAAVRGRIVKVETDRFTVRTADNQETTFDADPQTRVVIEGRQARLSDLKVGAEVTLNFRKVVSTVTVGAVETDAAKVTPLEGTVVRVVGQDQVIVRTKDNKEMVLYVTPQTKYVFADQPARFGDVRAGAEIRVEYDVRDRRNFARSIIGPRRR
jgi:translation initiation factor IF-1